MAEGIADSEKELFLEQEQEKDEDISTNKRFMELLIIMNNVCALGISLHKRQHESIVSDQTSTNTVVSAKKAKVTSLGVESVPDNEFDSETLLSRDIQMSIRTPRKTTNNNPPKWRTWMIPCLTKSRSHLTKLSQRVTPCLISWPRFQTNAGIIN